MLGRLIPLVLAVVLAITPMARAICEWSCADGIHGSSSTSDGHHGHSAPTPHYAVAGNQHEHAGDSHPGAVHDHASHASSASSHAATSLVPLCCAHADSRAVSIATAKIAFEPPAITLAAFDVGDLIAFAVSPALVSPVARPPVPLSLRRPLRV